MRILISVFTLVLFVDSNLVTAQDSKTKKAVKAPLSDAEKAAVAAIRKLGGSVLEVAQNDGRLDVAYHLTDVKVGEKHLALLKQLRHVHSLNLRGTDITDRDLASIAGLTSLERLHLEKTKVTDAGLAHLKGLVNLQYLNLYGTTVTDTGLKHLSGLKKLKKLYVWQTKITESGIKTFKTSVKGVRVIPDPEVERRRAVIAAKQAAEAKKAEELALIKAASEASKKSADHCGQGGYRCQDRCRLCSLGPDRRQGQGERRQDRRRQEENCQRRESGN